MLYRDHFEVRGSPNSVANVLVLIFFKRWCWDPTNCDTSPKNLGYVLELKDISRSILINKTNVLKENLKIGENLLIMY